MGQTGVSRLRDQHLRAENLAVLVEAWGGTDRIERILNHSGRLSLP